MDILFVFFICHVFFQLAANARDYLHLAVSVARNVPFARALAVVERQGELKISEANAGAKLPECTACPDTLGSASLCPCLC